VRPVGVRRFGWRVWALLVVAAAGTLAAIAGHAAATHAADGVLVPAGQRYEVPGPGPVHVLAVAAPGGEIGASATCRVQAAGGTDVAQVEVGRDRAEALAAGRRIAAATPIGLRCDRPVAVNAGPMVAAYPLGRYRWLLTAAPLLAVAGAVAVRHSPERRANPHRHTREKTGLPPMTKARPGQRASPARMLSQRCERKPRCT
jgi:hypothetical protein